MGVKAAGRASVTSLKMAVCAVALVTVGCGGNRAAQRAAEDGRQQQEFQGRKAGETRIAGAAEIAAELGCGSSRPRAARLERAEVLPVRPTAGREINHRFIYSACDLGPRPITGILVRRLMLGRTTLVEEKVPMTLRPGRWAVDVFIGIPAGAQPSNSYAVEIRFDHPQASLYDWKYFAIVAR